MSKQNLVLNNLQSLIYHKTQPTNTNAKPYFLEKQLWYYLTHWGVVGVRRFIPFLTGISLKVNVIVSPSCSLTTYHGGLPPFHSIFCVVFFFFFFFKFSDLYQLIGLVGRVFANGLGDQGSIPGRVIPKTWKMVLDTSLLNTQQYKVHIKGKMEQSRERSCALPYTSV